MAIKPFPPSSTTGKRSLPTRGDGVQWTSFVGLNLSTKTINFGDFGPKILAASTAENSRGLGVLPNLLLNKHTHIY